MLKVMIDEENLTAMLFEKIEGSWKLIDSCDFQDLDALGYGLHEWMTDAGIEPDGCRIYDLAGRPHYLSLV